MECLFYNSSILFIRNFEIGLTIFEMDDLISWNSYFAPTTTAISLSYFKTPFFYFFAVFDAMTTHHHKNIEFIYAIDLFPRYVNALAKTFVRTNRTAILSYKLYFITVKACD